VTQKLKSMKMAMASLVVAAAAVLPQAVIAQNTNAPAPVDDSKSQVTMTMYHVLETQDGQQYFVTQNEQRILLPGAGVNAAGVAVYTAPDGEQWYIDRTGTQQSLPPLSSYASFNSNTGPYGNGNYNSYDYYQKPVPKVYNNTAASGVGSLLGAVGGIAAGAAVGLGLGALPWGVPIYWGGGHPWYYGSGGTATYISNNNFGGFNEWQHLNRYNYSNWNHYNNWNRNNNWNNHAYWGNRRNWTNANWQNHWGNNNWPGKEHGFPPPHENAPGRLFAGEGRGFGERGFAADHGFADHGMGNRGFGDRGEHRGEGGGEHHEGEHHEGEHHGGEHHGGEHHGGEHHGGEHHGGGGHHGGGHHGGGHRR
jgi:hypothetical protein